MLQYYSVTVKNMETHCPSLKKNLNEFYFNPATTDAGIRSHADSVS